MKAFLAALSLFLPGAVSADAQGKVRPEPDASCRDFKSHDLCFDVPDDGIARDEYFSQPFYAVILKTAKRCSVSENERLRIQPLFPRSKVFSGAFSCDDEVAEFIRYTNVNDKFGFLAVYGGATLDEANERLAEVKATGMFPGANIRRMQAVFVFP